LLPQKLLTAKFAKKIRQRTHSNPQAICFANFALDFASFAVKRFKPSTRIERMKSTLLAILLCVPGFAQTPKSVTVPITLDHNRIVIDAYLPLPDGNTKRVRALVDTGATEMTVSQRVGELFGSVKCDAQTCETSLPAEIQVGGMKISLAGMQSAHAPAGVPKDVMIPGMAPEINLPASILRNYEAVFDYANRQFTIGDPGSVKFAGAQVSARVNPAGLVAVTGQFQGEKLNLSLNTGSPISLLAADRLAKWHAANSTWPYLKGAVGAANVSGEPDETARELLRVPELHVGTPELSGVVFASLPSAAVQKLSDRIGADTDGQLGGEAFRNCRVGIDYAHQTVYVDVVSRTTAPDMDVVGLTLRPRADGHFTVSAVLSIDGKSATPDVKAGDVLVGVDGAPVTGATLGQAWSLLSGTPGQSRALTLERDGKIFTVNAPVRRFLAVTSAAPVKSPHRNPHRRN
jgi:hypothetical protein